MDFWVRNNFLRTAYIIGGLVDHNRYKFATLNQAKEEGRYIKNSQALWICRIESEEITYCPEY